MTEADFQLRYPTVEAWTAECKRVVRMLIDLNELGLESISIPAKDVETLILLIGAALMHDIS